MVNIKNTYAWITLTRISRNIMGICIRITPKIILLDHLIKASKMCPAVMLATSRTLRVIGRIKILIISINVMKEMR